jgi:CheY-like chemotaxis protein
MEAKLLADVANKSKSRFLASMSHEIRTPMNAVLGFAQIMETSSTEKLSSRQKECIHQIMTGGRHLLALIDDVLDLSRIESGRADISLARVPPAGLVDECCTLAASIADQHGVNLIKPRNLADMPDGLADHTRLRQVLLNLVTNAIKYNKKGGSVILKVSLHTSTVLRFAVDDTGEGVSPDMVDELFKPFSRLGREALNIEGTGIGLVISKMLMEQMGGSIGYETRPGSGSTFWFDIPVADHNIPAIDEVTEEDVETRPRRSGHATVLYIEDNPANVDLIRRMVLDMPDISFLSAPDGEIGLMLARQARPDLVLLDLNLPGIDGYQVHAKLQEMEETRHSPVIALTALAMDEDIQRGVRAGFSSYITKPFDIKDVQSRIRSALDEQIVVGGE